MSKLIIEEGVCSLGSGRKTISVRAEGSNSGWRVWGSAKATRTLREVPLTDPRIPECIEALRGVYESRAVRGPDAEQAGGWADRIEAARALLLGEVKS